MGRILCSITEDTVGWHDPLGGCSNAASVARKYGEAPYQQFRNHFHRNGRDSFLVELEKWGLGPRDLTANVNFFSRVTVERRRVHDVSSPQFHVAFACGTARRDECAGDSQYLSASSGYESEIRAEASSLVDPQSAAGWARPTPAGGFVRKTRADSP